MFRRPLYHGTMPGPALPLFPLLLLLATLLLCAPLPAAGGERGDPRPAVDAMLGEISPDRLKAHVERLAAFGTRHTLSAADDPERGIGSARNWIRAEMGRAAAESGREGGEAVRVFFDTHAVKAAGRITRDVDVVNVVAEIPGAMPGARGRRYAVVAHYDSRASEANDAESDAPGANDDASVVAALLELLRVMSKRRYDATLVFLAVAGEEQGLVGSRAHARAARAAGLDYRAVLGNDIVGDPSGTPAGSAPRIRVFSEGIPVAADEAEVRRLRALGGENDSPSRQLARFIAGVGALHPTAVQPRLVFRPDRFLRGGDHSAFLEQGFAAVRFTDEVEQYHRQHQDVREEDGVRYGDVPEFVDGPYLAGVARLNGAVLAHLANAPSPPADVRVVAAALSHDTLLRWSPSPEPDTAGYEVIWRETTDALWTGHRDVGDATEATLPLRKDDVIFGVRAYDRAGHRSPVSFAGAARE